MFKSISAKSIVAATATMLVTCEWYFFDFHCAKGKGRVKG